MIKKLIIAFTLIIFIFGGFATYIYLPLLNPVTFIQQKFKNGFTSEYNQEVFKPFADADKADRFDKTWGIFTDLNPFEPILTYITFKKYDYGNEYRYIQFKLKRNWQNYQVYKVVYGFPLDKNSSEKDILDYAKNNFDKISKDDKFASIEPAPTREEVEAQKKQDKLAQTEKNKKDKEVEDVKVINDRYEYINSLPKNQKIEKLQELLTIAKNIRSQRLDAAKVGKSWEYNFEGFVCTEQKLEILTQKGFYWFCGTDEGVSGIEDAIVEANK